MNLRLCAEDGAVPAEQAERVQSSGRVLLGTVLLSTANISKLGLQLILVPILARLLGPSVFGLMSVAMSIVLLANMLSDGGMGSALVREQTRNRDLYSTVYWLSMGIGMFLAAMLCALSWPVAAIYRQPQLVPVLCALSPILILSSNLSVANAHIVRGHFARHMGLWSVESCGPATRPLDDQNRMGRLGCRLPAPSSIPPEARATAFSLQPEQSRRQLR
jgi:hypothetical protein